MKKKKGFTLVELIAVISILSIILLISIPGLVNNIQSRKGEASEKVYRLIETAAQNYIIDYSLDGPISIPITNLCERYIECPIIDPYTGEEIYGYISKNDNGSYKVSGEVKLLLELNGGGTTQSFEDSYPPYTTITMIPPTKENYDFLGWEVIKGNGKINGSNLMIGNVDTTLYAMWQSYPSLTVNLNEGTTSQSFKSFYKSGTSFTLTNPTRTGYTFNGWEVTEGDSIISGDNFTMGSKDTTIKANWTVNTYTITYNLNGGINGTGNPESGEYGSTITLNNPTKQGSTFNGWTVSGTGASISGTTLTIGTGNITLTANWLIQTAVEKIESLATASNTEGLITDDTADHNIRYVGASPKNYVKFNNETWRIIGIFNVTTSSGSTEKLMKIVRDTQFSTTMSWDSSSISVNEGYGVNEWSQADLKTMLNTYYIGTSTTCSYCNSYEQETCSKDCSSSVTPIGSTYRGMIEEVVWKTGAITYASSIERSSAYAQERGTTTGKDLCTQISGYCNASVARTTEWRGKVGLIYPSDYGYASTSGTDIMNSAIGTTNWLNFGPTYWTLSPTAFSDYDYYAWCVYSRVSYTHASGGYYVRPAIYLKSDVSITSGDGSSSLPYQISMN